VTFCTLHVAQRLRFFEPKPIDTQTVISFGFLNGISIGLLNLCLGFNSVGFYQVIKHASFIPLRPPGWPQACIPLHFIFLLVILLFYPLAADDQAGHYTLHHSLGNHLSEQEVQVLLRFLLTFQNLIAPLIF
jgi:hypothetical protein